MTHMGDVQATGYSEENDELQSLLELFQNSGNTELQGGTVAANVDRVYKESTLSYGEVSNMVTMKESTYQGGLDMKTPSVPDAHACGGQADNFFDEESLFNMQKSASFINRGDQGFSCHLQNNIGNDTIFIFSDSGYYGDVPESDEKGQNALLETYVDTGEAAILASNTYVHQIAGRSDQNSRSETNVDQEEDIGRGVLPSTPLHKVIGGRHKK